uniref:Uncharacterized protein n=1 Tax=Glossina austeni TaxID=7395 RepID=A0A1A9VLQ0_GLOAU
MPKNCNGLAISERETLVKLMALLAREETLAPPSCNSKITPIRIIAFGTLCFALSLLVVIRRHTAMVLGSGSSNTSSRSTVAWCRLVPLYCIVKHMAKQKIHAMQNTLANVHNVFTQIHDYCVHLCHCAQI